MLLIQTMVAVTLLLSEYQSYTQRAKVPASQARSGRWSEGVCFAGWLPCLAGCYCSYCSSLAAGCWFFVVVASWPLREGFRKTTV